MRTETNPTPETPGVRRPLVLIPCGGAKLTHPAPAADLYTSSTFRMALDAARSIVRPYGGGDECIRIVSAKHGLVRLDAIVDPYDVRMTDADAVSPATIRAQAHAEHLDVISPTPVMLLPSAYARTVEASGAWNVDDLIDGCHGKMIGETRASHAHTTRMESHRANILARRDGNTNPGGTR